MPKQYASLLFRFTLLFAVLISSFLIMDWAAYSIPNGAVADNVIKSEKRILEEGTYPNPTHVAFFQQDNYTDALMLSLCVTGDSTATPIQNAMTNPYLKNDSTPMSQIGIDAATGKTDMHQPDFYGRYWHGYLLPLKAFSTVGDIWAIRITNYVALTLLLALASYLVWRRRGSRMAWAFLATMLLLGYPGIPLCMQFASCFYILFISVITLLLFEKTFSSTGNLCLAFFAIGSLTSFSHSPSPDARLPIGRLPFQSMQPEADETDCNGINVMGRRIRFDMDVEMDTHLNVNWIRYGRERIRTSRVQKRRHNPGNARLWMGNEKHFCIDRILCRRNAAVNHLFDKIHT